MGKEKRIVYKYDNETYQQKLDDLYNKQFELIGDYIDARGHIDLRCRHCNYKFNISCASLGKNETVEKCPNCKIRNRENEIKNIIEKLYDDIIVHSVTYDSPEKYMVDYSCKKHNTRYTKIAKSMIYENSSVWLCDECKKEHFLAEKLEYIENKFPITLKNGYILNHIGSYVENGKIYVNCIDQEGYKYSFEHDTLSSIQCNTSDPNRFFKRNPYTYDNINLFCKLNNIDLQIDGTGLPVSGYARENIPFTDSKGNTVITNWNVIQNRKIKYRTSDEVIRVKNRMYMSKEKAIPIIKNMQETLGRPLLQSDFENTVTSDDSIGIRVIWRIWGTFNNMIDELGLLKHDYYFKPNDKNYIPHDEIINSIKNACEKVLAEHRNTIMISDLEKYTGICINRLRNHCKLENTTLNKMIESYGCKLQKCGNGLNHTFDDGEKIVSKYEYDFSIFLRENGFIYDKTYFRNIYYNKFDSEYKGNMNCDYCIDFNGQLVYIELAGILCNNEHQEAYRSNTPIKSKSKEEYRLKLNQKREIFERNNLEYYILLPDEMNEETYKNILKKYLKEAA